jgi:N-acetylglutamate synthase-like GNAT family acetyltransferase
MGEQGVPHGRLRNNPRAMTGDAQEWAGAPFTEKAFYLADFRERTLAIAGTGDAFADPGPLRAVFAELEQNRTRIVLLTGDAAAARALAAPIVALAGERALGSVWRALRSSPRVTVLIDGADSFPAACRALAVSLRISKLIFLDSGGALVRGDGARLSFVDLGELAALLQDQSGDASRRAPLLREIDAALRGGVAAVNLCTASGLGEELFSYAGSGTLFTVGNYVEVRPLGIDDFAAARDLVARGVAEGYLALRSEPELDRVLANGYGAFVEHSHLAGIGALVPHPESGTGEIASLYTLTRFLGEGIGGHLVASLCRVARERRYRCVFACTTSERVAGFFERNGFRRVDPGDVPAEKWRDYDPERRERVLCLRRELA